jgi:hypothetical protein
MPADGVGGGVLRTCGAAEAHPETLRVRWVEVANDQVGEQEAETGSGRGRDRHRS